ncbi:DUF397 domain-containing protein [Streptomyces sparsogenes]
MSSVDGEPYQLCLLRGPEGYTAIYRRLRPSAGAHSWPFGDSTTVPRTQQGTRLVGIDHVSTSSHLNNRQWLRSRSCRGGNDNCVEIFVFLGRVALRDSKRPDLAHTSFTPAAWREFFSALAVSTLS